MKHLPKVFLLLLLIALPKFGYAGNSEKEEVQLTKVGHMTSSSVKPCKAPPIGEIPFMVFLNTSEHSIELYSSIPAVIEVTLYDENNQTILSSYLSLEQDTLESIQLEYAVTGSCTLLISHGNVVYLGFIELSK